MRRRDFCSIICRKQQPKFVSRRASCILALNSRNFNMTRGNQRELARQKNQKKLEQTGKKKTAEMKDGNQGMSLETRKHRDAEAMREKQKKAEVKKGQQASTSTAT